LSTQLSFDEIYSEYRPYVSKIVSSFLTRARKEDRQDAEQNVWLKIFEGLSTFREECSLKTWIATIARNEAISSLKKLPICVEFQPEKHGKSISSPEHYVELKEAFESIPEADRNLMTRYVTESRPALAEEMGITTKKLSERVRYLRKKYHA